MKKSLILIAAIALVAVAAFGVKFTAHRSDRATNNKDVTQGPALAVYQDAQYGFSFSYPGEWKLSRLNDNDSVVIFDAADGSRMTVYASDLSGSGISPLLQKQEDTMVVISGVNASEQIWTWSQQAPNAGQTGLVVVHMSVAGGPLEIDFQPAAPDDLLRFQGVLNSLTL